MGRRIASLLDEPEPKVTKQINILEEKNGFPSHDARFIAESVQKIRKKIADLGLDPDDTTGEELYHALLARFQGDNSSFDAYFDAQELSADELTAKATQLLTDVIELPKQWALKNTPAKSILRQLPPKHVMKQLHYRSVESMLKRGNLAEIYLVAQQLESATWQRSHQRLVSKLPQTAFELRSIKIQHLNSTSWSNLDRHNLVAHNNEVGAIGVSQAAIPETNSLLTMLILLIEELSKFTSIKLSHALAKMSDKVQWWSDMDHLVANLVSEHVSMSIKDNALNTAFNNSYKHRVLDHGRTCFWQELVNRYENLPDIEAAFDNSVKDKLTKLKLAIPEPAFDLAEDFGG
jgi:hypothetical protein